MRKYIVIILVLIGFSSIAQTPPRTGYLVQPAKWKFVNPIWLDSGAYITKISKTSGQNRYLVYDSVKGTIGYRYATTIDTTSLSNRINLRVKYTDTSSMLAKYLRSADTLKLRRDVNLKVPYTGATGDVDLGNFNLNAKAIHAKGTAGTGHLGLKHQSSSATASGNETVIFANSSGYLYSKNDGNTIEKIIGANDTSSMLSKYLRAADTLKLRQAVNLRVKYTDTSTMLSKYLRSADTLKLSNRINLRVKYTDTASMLSKYLRAADTLKLSNRINLKQNTLSLTTTGTSGAATLVGATLNIPQYSGGVTSVTGTAPVVSSGGTTPAISMAAATTFVDGYLTSTDWNTFNGKESVLTFSRGLSRATNTVRLDTSKSYLFTAGMKLSGLSNTFGQSRVAVIDSVTGAVGYKYISSGGGAVTGSSGISVSGSDVLLGQAAAGSGASDFAANRFLYLSTFALQIGGSSGNDLFKFDNVGLNTISSTSLGTTQVDTKGLLLQNTTAAAVNAQQISPSIHWKANGWKTNSTAGSQSIDMRAYLLPVQGTANPTSQWKLQTSVNGGAYTDCFRVNTGSSGQVDVKTLYLGGNSLGTGYDGTADFYSSANVNAGIITANAHTFSLRSMSSGTARLVLWNYQGRYYMNCMDDGTNATIAINNGTTKAAVSSVLDVNSTTAGVLIPRMTTTQRTTIATPAEGLMVYDLTLHKLYVYDGTIWNAAW